MLAVASVSVQKRYLKPYGGISREDESEKGVMYYFAYGSNMNPVRMKEREVNYSQRKHAILIAYRLEFNKVSSRGPKEGYANIVPDKAGAVEGVLYDIIDSDLLKLDEHEGYPVHYDRIMLSVFTDDRQNLKL